MCWPGGQHLLLAIDQVRGIERGDLKAVSVRDRIGRARFYAVSAKDAAVVIDVVNFCIPFGAAHPMLGSVLRCLDVNAIRGTGRSAQKARNTFLQAVLVALQDMNAAVPLLEFRALQRPGTIGIILNDGGLKHLPEGDAHTLGDRRNVL